MKKLFHVFEDQFTMPYMTAFHDKIISLPWRYSISAKTSKDDQKNSLLPIHNGKQIPIEHEDDDILMSYTAWNYEYPDIYNVEADNFLRFHLDYMMASIGYAVNPIQIYLNMYLYDQRTVEHGETETQCYHLLHLCNSYWEPEWGGENCFEDDETGEVIEMEHKPGRIVLFDHSIKHWTKPVKRHNTPRFTYVARSKELVKL